MTTIIIDLRPASEYDKTNYNIEYRSEYVYRVTGKGVHNRSFPHRLVVWNNTDRPNPHPGETRWTEFGRRGGDGKYLDPSGHGTDDEWSFHFSSECIAITNNGTNTGTKASGQVYADEKLWIGNFVVLRYPDGTLSNPFKVASRPLADPVLVPVS